MSEAAPAPTKDVMPHALSGKLSDASSATDMARADSAQMRTESGSLRTASDAARHWSSAARKVSIALDVMNRFMSLRETAGSAYIEKSRLTPVRALGAGAFAHVELCKLDGEKEVAVKTLKAELFNNQTDLEDFVKEGVLLESLSHPSIVKVIGLGFTAAGDGKQVSPESMFMVAELCRGGSLRDVVRDQMMSFSKVIYTYADALRWSISIAEGLAYLHKHKPMIIHRDVKLDNVLLQGQGDDKSSWEAKLTDFGLHATVEARDTSQVSRSVRDRAASTAEVPEGSKEAGPAPKLGTRATLLRKMKSLGGSKTERNVYDLTGQTGSFLNMAPEVVLGKPYDNKCDIFSLGTILYEIFAKSIAAHDIAFHGTADEFQIYATRVARGYRRPHPVNWSPDLSQLVTDCMHQNPEDRPKATEVAQRLRDIGASGQIAAMDAKSGGGCCTIS